MAVLLRESSVITVTSGGSFSVNLAKPTGTVDGDKLLVLVQSSASSVTLSPPAGWTAVDNSGDVNQGAYLFSKTASSEGSTFSFTGNTGGNSSHIGICVALYDDAGGTPTHTLYTETVDSTADTTADNTGVTPTMTPGALLLALIGSRGLQTSYSTYAVANNNPTWTELQDTSANLAGEAASAAAAYATGRDLLTATGAFSATIANSAPTTVYLFSCQPTAFALTANLGTLAGSGKSPQESSAQTLAPNLATLAGSGKSTTATQGAATVANQSKNNGSFSNTTKHAASFSNTTKNNGSWSNVTKHSV